MRRLLSSCLALCALILPTRLAAQDGFLFKQPRVTFGLQAGQTLPSASDGVFDLFTRELTLEKSDFAAFSVGGDIGVRATDRLDIVLGLSYASSSKSSEFRDWVDNNDLPIEQSTDLRRVPLTLSARFFPTDRGRSVGRYAWVPSPLLPYVGAGVGVTWYKLEQEGDFVDSESLDIFYDRLESNNVAPTVHVLAGAQWWPTSRFGLTGEARYSWGSASLDNGFSDFDSINLKGFQWTAGVAARF